MRLMLDSFWRAVVYCLMPRVMLLSLLPLLMLLVVALSWGYFFWQSTQDWVRDVLASWQLLQGMLDWMQAHGAADLQSVMVPLVVIFSVTPVLVVMTLLAVSLMMGPALLDTVGSTLAALLAMVITLPLWLVPPLMFVIPPLIWGWLSYRVMVFDALAVHASRDERMALGRSHRGWLLLMGVITGYMGALPSVVWASGALFAAAFVVLVPLAIWIYAVVFAFTALWFTHYSLAALESLRAQSDSVVVGAAVDLPALASGDEQHLPPPPP